MIPLDRFNQLVALTEQGLSRDTIAERLGVPAIYVSGARSILGLNERKPRNPNSEMIVADYKRGDMIKVIEGKYKTTTPAILRMVKAAGVPLRRPPKVMLFLTMEG